MTILKKFTKEISERLAGKKKELKKSNRYYIQTKRIITFLLLLSMIVSCIYSNLNTKYVSAGSLKEESENFDYVIYSETKEQISCNSVCINGKVKQGELAEFSIKQDLSRRIKENGDKCYSDENIFLDNECASVLGSLKTISIKNECMNISDAMYYSKESDIKIHAKEISMSGLLYAPEGTIEIQCNNLNFSGTIIAKNVILIASGNINMNRKQEINNYINNNQDIYTEQYDIYQLNYDEWGNLAEVSVAGNQITKYVYKDSFYRELLCEEYANDTEYSYNFDIVPPVERNVTYDNSYASFDYDDSQNSLNYFQAINGEESEEKYIYDNKMNISKIQSDTSENTYFYDERGRLISATYPELDKSYSYKYDNRNNIIECITKEGNLKKKNTYSYRDEWKDKLSQYNSLPVCYDECGNITFFDGYIYSWENGSQLKCVENSELLCQYKYDPYGIRQEKLVDGEKVKYYYSEDKLVKQTSNNTVLKFIYDSYDRISALNYNNVMYYFLLSGQGDVKGIIDTNGSIVVKYQYSPYGEIESISGELADSLGKLNPIRYRGYYYDIETGLYYLNHRYYNPKLGRFISPDDMNYIFVENNLYNYCEGNPINNIDETGRLNWKGGNPIINSAADAKEFDSLKNNEKSLLYTLGFKYNNSLGIAEQCLRTRKKYGINTREEKAHFWAQCYVETDGGYYLKEAGSDAYFAKQPYGKKYRGAGFIQLTWKENYKAYSKAENNDKILSQGADYVAKEYPWFSAGWFWNKNSINTKIKNGATVKDVTKIVNGGTGKLEERKNAYKRIKKLL